MSDKRPSDELAWLPIAAVRRWDGNPRVHPERQVRALAGLMRRVGFVNPVVIWRSKDRMVAGHGRLDACELIERETPGAILPHAPGPAMCRVLFHEFASEQDAETYALGDNRLSELAENDDGMVAAILARHDAETRALAGYSQDDVAKFLAPSEADAFARLPSGDREPFEQLTFTLHDSQALIVREACAKAKLAGSFDGLNANSNGNALARIAEAFLRG